MSDILNKKPIVLIVDDERVTRAFHRAILAQHFDVLTAASGAEALELCVGQTPDLIVLDVEMPGIDGYETCRRLRAFTSVPILFVTGHQSLEEHLKAFDAGGTDLITKPVNAEIFQRKVAVAIRQYRAAAALADAFGNSACKLGSVRRCTPRRSV